MKKLDYIIHYGTCDLCGKRNVLVYHLKYSCCLSAEIENFRLCFKCHKAIEIPKGLIGYYPNNIPHNRFKRLIFKVLVKLGFKKITGMPIVVTDKVNKDKTVLIYKGGKNEII